MTGSEPISRAFYDAIGKDGLSQRTRPDWDRAIVASLLERIATDARVLDIGCGYGRICLPLARQGLDVHGLDLSARLIGEARAVAEADRTPAHLVVGSMTSLPYPDASFDVALCLWSAFNELLAFDEQVRTLAEMRRVLAAGGWALIEGRPYEPASLGRAASAAGIVRWTCFEDLVGRQDPPLPAARGVTRSLPARTGDHPRA